MLHGQLDFERERWSKVHEENQRLTQRIEQLELELKLERQNKFATNQQKNESAKPESDSSQAPSDSNPAPKKRGAPVGHPGWFRPTPAAYDRLVEVDAPGRCPFCDADAISVYDSQEPADHLQEDILEGRYHITLFRHPVARCRSCRRWVKQCGEGEILGSRIGPQLRATAVYLRNEIGISYRRPTLARRCPAQGNRRHVSVPLYAGVLDRLRKVLGRASGTDRRRHQAMGQARLQVASPAA